MFQFRRFPTYAYLIQRTLTEYCSAGFPHSEICGSKLMCSSPQLIAACHVLHRLLMPRHSPCALSSLTFVESVLLILTRSWIMQAPQKFCKLATLFYPYLKFHNIAVFALCCLLLYIFVYIVQFSRCWLSNLFQGQIETSDLRLLQSKLESLWKFSLLTLFFKRE